VLHAGIFSYQALLLPQIAFKKNRVDTAKCTYYDKCCFAQLLSPSLFFWRAKRKEKQKEKRLLDLSLRGSKSRLFPAGKGGAGFPSAAFYLLGCLSRVVCISLLSAIERMLYGK
jgi:hypothetical protein